MSFFLIMPEAVTNKELPEVSFKHDTPLYDEVVNLTGLADITPADESEEDKIERWLSEISTVYHSHATDVTSVVDRIATSFAGKIEATADTLKSIKNMVTELVKEIDDKSETLLLLDSRFSKPTAISCSDVQYDDFPFDIAKVVGDATSLFAYIKETTGIGDDSLTTRPSLELAVDKFFAKVLSDKVELNKVELSAERKEAVITYINDNCTSKCANDIRNTLVMLTDPDTIRRRRNTLLADTQLEVTEGCIAAIRGITDFKITVKSILDVLTTGENDFADIVKELEPNVKFLEDMSDIAACYVQWHRYNTFKNTVFMRGDLINPDMKLKLKESGLTYSDIKDHVRFLYNGTPIATTGITLGVLKLNVTRVEGLAKKHHSQEMLNNKIAIDTAKRSAFSSTLLSFFSDTRDQGNVFADEDLKKYIATKGNAMVSNDIALEDVIYDVIISTRYPDSFVQILHKRLGSSYLQLITDNEDIHTVDVCLATAKTYCELITEFVFDHFMEKTC